MAALDIYDDFPRDMKNYLRHNGWHFNRKACEFAVSLMKRKNEATKSLDTIEPWSKDNVDELLKKYGISILSNKGYDYVFAANFCKARHLGGSVPDETHVAKFVKETVDDDIGDGTLMRKWYAETVSCGIPVDWEEML